MAMASSPVVDYDALFSLICQEISPLSHLTRWKNRGLPPGLPAAAHLLLHWSWQRKTQRLGALNSLFTLKNDFDIVPTTGPIVELAIQIRTNRPRIEPFNCIAMATAIVTKRSLAVMSDRRYTGFPNLTTEDWSKAPGP